MTKKLLTEQLNKRKSSSIKSAANDIRIGDTVTSVLPQDKHKAHEIYLVTKSKPDKITAQRLLHPLTDKPTKFKSREYVAHPKHVQTILRLPPPHSQSPQQSPKLLQPPTKQVVRK